MNTHSDWSRRFPKHPFWLVTSFFTNTSFDWICIGHWPENISWNIGRKKNRRNKTKKPADIWEKCKEPTEDNLVEGRKCIHSVKIPDWHGNSKTWRECNRSHGNGRDFHLSWTSRLVRTSFWSFIMISQQDYLKARFLFVSILRPCVPWSYNHIHKWSWQKIVLWCSVRV